MAVRQRLALEHLALHMLDMRLRYGDVELGREIQLRHEGRCIRCGQVIEPGPAHQAHWSNRPTTGLYAHVKCPPLVSDWLSDDEYYDVFDYVVTGHQWCADCRVNVSSVRVLTPNTDRFPNGGVALRYVCGECVQRPVRSRS